MDKVLLFVVAVIIGVVGVLLIQNNSSPTNKSPIMPTLPPEGITPIQTLNQNQTSIPQSSPTPTLTPMPLPESSISATIKTSKGDIELTLYGKEAPNTVRNFMEKAKNNFYNNLTFHRVEDWVIQGGDPEGTGRGGGDMPVEFNDKPFVVGSLGVASRGDGKVQNDAQFFITKKESSHLNGQYTNFGMVTKGMDVAEKIEIGDKILGITIK